MRRLTVEVHVKDPWRPVLTPRSDDVEVVEIVRTFKCDAEGFALLCRMIARDEYLQFEELSGNGILSNVETLHQEEDGSWMVYLVGKMPDPSTSPEVEAWNPVLEGTPEFVDVDRMRVTLLMNEDEVHHFRQLSQKYPEEMPLRILAVSSMKPEAESHLARLTGKQRKALLLAYALGYYDTPRKISSYELARRLKVNNSTLVEHLRKAQKRLLSGVMSG